MRNYTMVSPAIWRSKRFGSLSDDAKLAFLYLLTCEHQNSAGCSRIIPGYAGADLGGWPADRYSAAMAALVAADMVLVDDSTNEVLIRRWFKHSPPMNPKHHAGTERRVDDIESDKLKAEAARALAEAWALTQAQQAVKTAQSGARNITSLLQRR